MKYDVTIKPGSRRFSIKCRGDVFVMEAGEYGPAHGGSYTFGPLYTGGAVADAPARFRGCTSIMIDQTAEDGVWSVHTYKDCLLHGEPMLARDEVFGWFGFLPPF